MKKIVFLIVLAIVVVGLGVTSVRADLVPAFLNPAKEGMANEDVSVAVEPQDEEALPEEQPGDVPAASQESNASVQWCRDEFGRLFNVVVPRSTTEGSDIEMEIDTGGVWYRDAAGRLYNVISSQPASENTGLAQSISANVLWCRDESGRIFNLIETQPTDEMGDLYTESGSVVFWYRNETGRLSNLTYSDQASMAAEQHHNIGGYWYRDASGRLYKTIVKLGVKGTSGPGGIWYRDETGRLLKSK
jgi:hypothetical protein